MKYAEQRIPTLNEYCVVCDEQHVFQNGSMLKVYALICDPLPWTLSQGCFTPHLAFLSSWVYGKGRILSIFPETLEIIVFLRKQISAVLFGKMRIYEYFLKL